MENTPINILKENTKLFSSIGIETSSLCNRRCFFCPNSEFARPDELMSEEMFKKIIDELSSLKYKGRVEFYIYNEPMRDKRLLEFIEYTRSKLKSACLMINTNGDYFKSHQDIAKLFLAGLNQMQINIYSASDGTDDEGQFLSGIEKSKKREKKMQEMVDECKTYIPQLSEENSLYQNIGPNKMAVKVVAKYGIKKDVDDKDVDGVNHFSNRSGNVQKFRDVVQEPMKKGCTRPFRFLNINWKGEAILCCNDYYSKTAFGSVNEKTLVELWNDKRFHKYRLKLQNKKRDIYLCHNCDFKGGSYQHMIQPITFGDKLDEKILNSDLSKRDSVFSND